VYRATECGIVAAAQLPANHTLSTVDFGAAYVGENLSEYGLFSNRFSMQFGLVLLASLYD